MSTTTTEPVKTGNISDAFVSLSGSEAVELPARFAALKKELWDDRMLNSWSEVLAVLKERTKEIARTGPRSVPQVDYKDIAAGTVSAATIAEVKRVGTVLIRGVVSQEKALGWKNDILSYAQTNKDHVTGYPADNIQVFELYNTKSQTEARTNSNTVTAQQWLLDLLYTSDPESRIGLKQPMSYYDRLRVRQPGDSKFALGPHIDGGSLERWEDPGYRNCFSRIFQGDWKAHDPYDVSPRIDAITDLYHVGLGGCSVFRPWQGWTALSHTSPGEGTLRVFPDVGLSTAYWVLRPFFKLKEKRSGGNFDADDWEVDLESTTFPGSAPGKGQELSTETHPDLDLLSTMVSVPTVQPGDQVYWHTDVIHAVESLHAGKGDSSVLYIPAVPLTLQNANYLKDQVNNYKHGLPAPDFPQGKGESLNEGRSIPEDVVDVTARRMLGLHAFEPVESSTPGEVALIREANAVLSF